MENQHQKLILTYLGADSWNRPIYVCDGKLYVDVNPRLGYEPDIYTKYKNAFDGEPDVPIKDDIELEFVPKRMVWY